MRSTNENIRLFRPFLRGLPLIALAVAVCVAAAKRYIRYATPIYESTAKIRLADTKDGSPSANLFKDFDVFANVNKIGAEIEVIKSSTLMEKTLQKLDFGISTYRVGQIRTIELYDESPFRVTASFDSASHRFDKLFKFQLKKDSSFVLIAPEGKVQNGKLGMPVYLDRDIILIALNTDLLARKPGIVFQDNFEFIVHSRQKLIADLIEHTDVGSVDKEIPILRISFKSPVARKAADYVNALAKTYIEDYVDSKVESANTAVDFLNNQIVEAGGKLATSENAIEDFRNVNNIINIRQETETELRKLSDLRVQQTNVKMNLDAISDLYNYMVEGRDRPLELAPNFEAYTDLLATELVKKMKILQAEKTDLLVKYTPEHEQIKAIDEKLRQVSNYLQEGINNSRKNLQVKHERLSRDIEEAEKVFIGLPNREKTLGILNRRFMLNEQNYNFLNTKRTEAQISRAANISFHRILTAGEIPKAPVSPNATLLTVLAAFLGFMGSLVLIYIIHAIKGKVNDVTTVEKNSSIPVHATTPRLKKDTEKAYFQKLVIQLEMKNILEKNKILALSSFSANEGKRFNTEGIANELSAKGHKVLVVYADGKTGRALSDAAQSINLLDIPGVTHTETMQRRMEQWRESYDMVLIKNEDLLKGTVGVMLMKLANKNLFILDSRKTSAKMIAEAEILQEEYQFPCIGFMLNREGYHPNLILQATDAVKKLIQTIISRKWSSTRY